MSAFAERLKRPENLAIGTVIFAAFALRLWTAHGTFLNPDEALHFQIANQPSWSLAYRASLTTAHPPLLIFVLHFWRALGCSEFLLRLPEVLAGTIFCWLLFRWISLLFGRMAGWIALIFAAFLPPLVALSAELRQYPWLLMFMMGALLLLERAFREQSPADMLLAYVCVLLAMLTHYSALLFAVALGIDSFYRWMEGKYPARLKTAWAAGQVLVIALFDFLYRTHLARLHSGGEITGQPWLSNSLFHRGQQNLLVFIFARSFGVFQFVFGQLALGDLAAILFIVAIVYLIRGNTTRLLALLLAIPFALTCAAAIAGKYPYGGTRHSAWLIPFAIAGVAAAISQLTRGRAGIFVALAVVAISAALGTPHRPYMARADQSRDNMSRAVIFLKQNAPAGSLILTDYQSSLLVGNYLCQQQPVTFDRSLAGFLLFHCGGYRVLSTGPETSIFTAESFLHGDTWSILSQKLRLPWGTNFWVVQAGWDISLASQLNNASPHFRDLSVASFGRDIQIFPMILEPEGPVVPRH